MSGRDNANGWVYAAVAKMAGSEGAGRGGLLRTGEKGGGEGGGQPSSLPAPAVNHTLKGTELARLSTKVRNDTGTLQSFIAVPPLLSGQRDCRVVGLNCRVVVLTGERLRVVDPTLTASGRTVHVVRWTTAAT